jgi:hypothetical protein
MERIEEYMESGGFTGVYINGMTFSNDILLVAVFLLLSIFSVIFRQNTSSFGKMVNCIVRKEPGNNLFDTADKGNFLFNVFMDFQAPVLSGIYIFSLAAKYGYVESPGIKTTLLCTVGLIFIFFIFYLFKRFIFNTLLYIFAKEEEQNMLNIIHKSLFRLWSVFLYIPVFWILLIGEHVLFSIILFIISYILFKTILAYKFIFFFFGKNIWLLFLNLYLCAQEIVPLLFLYEGLIYIYNIIDK